MQLPLKDLIFVALCPSENVICQKEKCVNGEDGSLNSGGGEMEDAKQTDSSEVVILVFFSGGAMNDFRKL